MCHLHMLQAETISTFAVRGAKMSTHVHVGVDVGGTNTDAVIIEGNRVLGWSKHVTTSDVTKAVSGAIHGALNSVDKEVLSGTGCAITY